MSKQVLDVQQMQHLQELGLELDYDTLYRYVKFEDTDWLLKPFSDLNIIGISFRYIPAYTLQDVLDALPEYIYDSTEQYLLEINMFFKYIRYSRFNDVLTKRNFDRTPIIDAAYELLVWCIENKFVETNKNE